MNASVISALAALAGTAVGGLTSVVANWLTHRIQVRAQWLQHEKNQRQILYRDFIDEASKCYIDALQHDEADIAGLVGLYAKLGRMRVLSSKPVVLSAMAGSAKSEAAALAWYAAIFDFVRANPAVKAISLPWPATRMARWPKVAAFVKQQLADPRFIDATEAPSVFRPPRDAQ